MKQEILPLAVYDTVEVSKLLNLSLLSVQNYIRKEKIKASRVGNGYRVVGKDLLEFLAQESPSLDMASLRLEQALETLDVGHTPRPGEDRLSPFYNSAGVIKGIAEDSDTKADLVDRIAGFMTAEKRIKPFTDGNIE